MALEPTIKEQPQYGVGQFETQAAFNGLLGLRFAWGTTLGRLLPRIDAGLARINRGTVLGVPIRVPTPTNLFGASGQDVLAQIGKGLTATQPAAAEKWVTEAWALDGIGATIERIAEDAVKTRKVIRHRTQPREVIRVIRPNVQAQIRPVARRARTAELRAEAAEQRARALEHRLAQLERQVAKPHSVAVPGLWPRIGGIERELDRLKGRVGRIGKYAGLGAFLILLAKALEKIGGSFIRCSNVKRYGRSICGMDQSLLDSLLADSLLIVGSLSLVQMARELEPLMGQASTLTRRFWRVR